jgi:hypothetical protein
LTLVKRTQYEPVVETEIEDVDAPVDQRWPLPAEEVSVTLPPVQKVVAPPGVIVGLAGTGSTVTAMLSAALVPQAFPAVTESVPDVADDEKSTVTWGMKRPRAVSWIVAPAPE